MSPEFLAAINPGCAYAPKDFDRHAAIERARMLFAAVRNRFPEATFDDQVQDATYHAGISVGTAEIRLSNFGRLATTTSEEKLDPDAVSRLVEQIRAEGYTYVPFALFGEPFSKRHRFAGDLFTQLFDYV